jgi:hypothetical protein
MTLRTGAGTAVVLALLLGTRSAHAGNDAAIGAVTTTQVRVPDQRSDLVEFGTGVGASLLYLELGKNVPTGVEFSTLFLVGDEGQRLFDLGISVIGSFPIKNKVAAPFLKFGLDIAAVTIPTPGMEPNAGDSYVSIGVHGALGLHGFLTEDLFWRAEAGFIGAGVGGITGQLAIGWTFERGL